MAPVVSGLVAWGLANPRPSRRLCVHLRLIQTADKG